MDKRYRHEVSVETMHYLFYPQVIIYEMLQYDLGLFNSFTAVIIFWQVGPVPHCFDKSM